MSITETVVYFIKDVIDVLGYSGVLALMALENSVFPIPSEAILCFAGWLAYDGKMDLILITLVGTVGSVMGCVLMYYLGLWGGRRVVRRWGRYFFVKEKDLDLAVEWFQKHGDWAVMFSRMVPVLRTVISLPAGMAKMKLSRFIAFTFLGTLPYVALLTYIGYLLGPNWATIFDAFGDIEKVLFAAVAVGLVSYIAWKKWGPRKNLAEVQE